MSWLKKPFDLMSVLMLISLASRLSRKWEQASNKFKHKHKKPNNQNEAVANLLGFLVDKRSGKRRLEIGGACKKLSCS